jgi:hypothetical protein
MGKRRRIGGRAKRVFLRLLRRGLQSDQAAAAAGHSGPGFYALRRRDPEFAREWAAAMDASAGLALVRPNNRRRLQRRQMRHVRFDAHRQEIFLSHFAGCGDAKEAASVARVDKSTVYKHRRKDAGFAARFDEALAQAYAQLEAEAVHQRLAAQERLRRAFDEGAITGEVSEEFERVMRLLERWDRRNGTIGVRAVSPERRQGLSFDEALRALETQLNHLDIPILQLPPALARRYDGGDQDGAEAGALDSRFRGNDGRGGNDGEGARGADGEEGDPPSRS